MGSQDSSLRIACVSVIDISRDDGACISECGRSKNVHKYCCSQNDTTG